MPNSQKKPTVLRCPTCNAIVLLGSEDVPFCSDRCRRIDLGKWASGAYKISSPILDPDVLESLPEIMNAPRRPQDDENDD
jgi:endogenous inhibitor of DNA gyrase (YacG/DUF329 family)